MSNFDPLPRSSVKLSIEIIIKTCIIMSNQVWIADRFCVLGDFSLPSINCDTLSSSNFEENHFNEMIHELSMIQRVRDPTQGCIEPKTIGGVG